MTITFLLLCWNHAKYLGQCFASLEAQTDQDFKVIFLDNASSDGSYDLACQLARSLPREVSLMRNNAPHGVSANMNKLFDASSTDLVAVLSTDDWYHPDYIATMRAAAAAAPEAAWFYPSYWEYHDAIDRLVPVDDKHYLSGDVFEQAKTLNWPFGWLGLMYRRQALIDVGGWDSSMAAEDNDLLLRLSEYGRCIHVPQYLVYYRKMAGSASSNIPYLSKNADQFFNKHRRHFPDWRRRLFEFYRIYAAMSVDKKAYRDALTLLVKALKYGRPNALYFRTLGHLLRSRFKSR